MNIDMSPHPTNKMVEEESADPDGIPYEVLLYPWKANTTVTKVDDKKVEEGNQNIFSLF